jgi:hypothetical protein
MRSLSLILLASLAVACGAPEVDVPEGNDQMTSPSLTASALPTPTIERVPSRYPYARLAVRGNAGNATRVLVEGAGNPVAATVSPLDKSFCIVVELAAAPANYSLSLRSQGGDGKLSAPVTIEVDRSNEAPAPANTELCDGSPAGD